MIRDNFAVGQLALADMLTVLSDPLSCKALFCPEAVSADDISASNVDKNGSVVILATGSFEEESRGMNFCFCINYFFSFSCRDHEWSFLSGLCVLILYCLFLYGSLH